MIKWSYGISESEKFQDLVFNFLTGLGSLGKELFGKEGIANITFDVKKRAGFKASEIFIVSLYEQFFLIISDPVTTLRLIMSEGEIPWDIKQVINAVLVGQASILYGTKIDDMNFTPEEVKDTIKLFRDIIIDINPEYSKKNMINSIVNKTGCNFSLLTFEECLLLHVYLRRQAEQQTDPGSSSWCLISFIDGGDIPFSYNIDDEVLLGGYLAAIIGFINALFESKPKHITFGSAEIRKLRFVYGETYFMAIDTSFMIDLLLKRQFQHDFFDTRYRVLKDLASGLKELIIEEILQFNEEKLNKLSAEILLDTYFRESSEDLELFIDESFENIELLREEHKNQVLRVWGRFLTNL